MKLKRIPIEYPELVHYAWFDGTLRRDFIVKTGTPWRAILADARAARLCLRKFKECMFGA